MSADYENKWRWIEFLETGHNVINMRGIVRVHMTKLALCLAKKLAEDGFISSLSIDEQQHAHDVIAKLRYYSSDHIEQVQSIVSKYFLLLKLRFAQRRMVVDKRGFFAMCSLKRKQCAITSRPTNMCQQKIRLILFSHRMQRNYSSLNSCISSGWALNRISSLRVRPQNCQERPFILAPGMFII